MTSERTVFRLSRILALIPYVLAHGGVEIDEVLERFDYTKEQLTRDLNTVFVCGLPGYGPGDLMEAYFDDDEVVIDAADYFSKAPRLTSAETLGLLASGLTVLGSGLGSPALESAVKKLAGAVMPGSASALAVDVPTESDLVRSLREAAAAKSVVQITYTSLGREETTIREVEPWVVVSTMGNWYLHGYCRLAEDERLFRVDRIRDMETLEKTFTPPARVPEPSVTYTPSADDIRCRILLRPEARWVLDYYPVDVVEDGPDGTVIWFSSADAGVPARLLLRLGGSGVLLEGEQVRQRVLDIGSALLVRLR